MTPIAHSHDEQIASLQRLQEAVRNVMPRTQIRAVPGDVPVLVVAVEPGTGRIFMEVAHAVDDYDLWLEGSIVATDLTFDQVVDVILAVAASPDRSVYVGEMTDIVFPDPL